MKAYCVLKEPIKMPAIPDTLQRKLRCSLGGELFNFNEDLGAVAIGKEQRVRLVWIDFSRLTLRCIQIQSDDKIHRRSAKSMNHLGIGNYDELL